MNSASALRASTNSINRMYSAKPSSGTPGMTKGVKIVHPSSQGGHSNDFLLRGFSASTSRNGFTSYGDLNSRSYSYIFPTSNDGIAEFARKPQAKPFNDRLTVDEIDIIIREKIKKERYAVQCMFKNADVHRNGFVTKGALLKIMYTLCGFMKIDQFHRILERYNLHKKPIISFKEFESAFTCPPTGRCGAPVVFAGMGCEHPVSVAYALQLFKDAAADPDFNLKSILPAAAFRANGVILKPQMREALGRIQIQLTDENFNRLWNAKFDFGGIGSMPTEKLLVLLNLDDNGRPMQGMRPGTAPELRPKVDRQKRRKTPAVARCSMPPNSERSPSAAGATSCLITTVSTWKLNGPGSAHELQLGGGDRLKRSLQLLRDKRPHFPNVLDCLRYIFEEPYQCMLIIFRQYDPPNRGQVTDSQCLDVFREYGFGVEERGLQTFLNRTGCRTERNGIVLYRSLLNKYQTRGDYTTTNRIMQDIIRTRFEDSVMKNFSDMSVEEIERTLVKTLHVEYITFIEKLQKVSQDGGVLVGDMRRIINESIGFSMTDDQFRDLRAHFKFIKDDVVNYKEFLNQFVVPTHVCKNKLSDKPAKQESVTKSARIDRQSNFAVTPRSAKESGAMSARIVPDVNSNRVDDSCTHPRNLETLISLIQDLLKRHFHAIDKTFKTLDIQDHKSMSKNAFQQLLRSHGLILTTPELESVWSLLDESESRHWNYRQLLRFFMAEARGKMEERTRMDRHNPIVDPSLSILRQFRKQQKAEKAAELVAIQERVDRPVQEHNAPEPSPARLRELCAKVTDQVRANWAPLKATFRQLDVVGWASVMRPQFKEVARKYKFNLTSAELSDLCSGFDYKRNGRVDYIEFLKSCTGEPVDTSPSGTRFECLLHKLQNQMIHDWQTLLRAFRKLDTNRTGKLTIDQLGTVLRNNGLQLSKDDLYHLLTGYDTDMDGRINYREFLEQTLDVYKGR